MDFLPIFADARSKLRLVAGGGEVALRGKLTWFDPQRQEGAT